MDPKTTFLSLVAPADLTPDFSAWMRNYRASGTVAKVNLALASLPTFARLADPTTLSGRIHVGCSLEYLERAFDDAKYGRLSSGPFLDVLIPSLLDPRLAVAGKYVMSIVVQYAPYGLREGSWDTMRDDLAHRTVETLEAYMPGLRSAIAGLEVLSPLDLERRFGVTGGHTDHGEMSLDQQFVLRPVAGWARYRTPIENLYLCGAGAHPGGGITGAPGVNAAREILRDWRRGPRHG